MLCLKCGHEIADDALFCATCGTARAGAGQPMHVPPANPMQFAEPLLKQFKALPVDALFPFRSWAQGRIWSGPVVRAILFFALFPLALSAYFGGDVTVKDAAWALGLYFALLWGWVIYSIARPPQVNVQYLLGVVAFTAIIGIPIDLLVQQFPIISNLYNQTDNGIGIGALLGFLCVGLVEESVKQLPIWWLALRARVLTTPRETAFYAAMSGLAFGVSEAVTYSLGYANQAVNGIYNQGADVEGNFIISEFLRLISLPFLHAMFSAVAGYFVGLAIVSPSRRAALALTGLGIAAVVHGLYDTTSGWSSWISLAVAAVAVLLFVGYLSNAESLSKHLEEPVETTKTL
jgi:RsiW-degrading membrane proteinase PrsW (M82 family)